MAVIRCPRCNGKGYKWDHLEGVVTFGLSYLFQAADGHSGERCERCNGKGYLIIKEDRM